MKIFSIILFALLANILNAQNITGNPVINLAKWEHWGGMNESYPEFVLYDDGSLLYIDNNKNIKSPFRYCKLNSQEFDSIINWIDLDTNTIIDKPFNSRISATCGDYYIINYWSNNKRYRYEHYGIPNETYTDPTFYQISKKLIEFNDSMSSVWVPNNIVIHIEVRDTVNNKKTKVPDFFPDNIDFKHNAFKIKLEYNPKRIYTIFKKQNKKFFYHGKKFYYWVRYYVPNEELWKPLLCR